MKFIHHKLSNHHKNGIHNASYCTLAKIVFIILVVVLNSLNRELFERQTYHFHLATSSFASKINIPELTKNNNNKQQLNV